MPKNIILLSDGTGNSSAQLLKTNVWRVYESLDLRDPVSQVACYDDGVGTSSFKPLALAGGAVGIGLQRNVLRLYRFLCEHYDPGDQIYAFGFSRGAFTIRVLVGLIASQGIIRTRPTSPVVAAYPGGSPSAAAATARAVQRIAWAEPTVYGVELKRLCRWAYREYRRERFTNTGPVVTAGRALRDAVLRTYERVTVGRNARYIQARNHPAPRIRFIGLWDTVDAYGLPVDELTEGINAWVWPLSAPDLKLSRVVEKACHVLAIDDERNTFHPVLWDESEETLKDGTPVDRGTHIDDERITQVWFAGMHSNVGGGYADDALSYVSLAWMTDEAAKHGVRFIPQVLKQHTQKMDPLGRIYDSRTGLKAYYRYNPRRIEWLTNGQVHEAQFGAQPPARLQVRIARPKIHESVFARIAAAPEAYAPIIFPARYGIVGDDGAIVAGADNLYEPDDDLRLRRAAAQEAAWNLVWWRRVLYFATVAATAVLLLLPFAREGTTTSESEESVASRLLSFANDYAAWTPDAFVTYYSAHALELYVLLGAVVGLMFVSAKVHARIGMRMRAIWSQVIPPPGRKAHELAAPRGWLYPFRASGTYLSAWAVVRRAVMPNVVGLLTLIAVALIALALSNRAAFEAVNVVGGVCEPQPTVTATRVDVDSPRTITVNTDVLCAATGVLLEEGSRYTVEVSLLGATDGDIPVASPGGIESTTRALTWPQRAMLVSFAPFRRVWGENWFVPVARIGERGFTYHPLARPENTFTARGAGELFLFVNDVIAPVRLRPFVAGWHGYYSNNRGQLSVTVTRRANAESDD